MEEGDSAVLVVEDDAMMQALLCRVLEDRYQVVVASNGKEGWKCLRRTHPDLLLSDVQLSGISGQALCRKVRNDSELENLPIILLTEGTATAREGRLGRTADEVLEKPFGIDELRQCVGRHLPSSKCTRGASVDAADAFLRDVFDEIERQLHDPDFTVEQLANKLALSRRHLTRRLKTALGETPAALIRKRRIERAKDRLIENPPTIAEVAEAVGFRSPSHFSQTFRDHVGCVPSTYVDQHAP